MKDILKLSRLAYPRATLLTFLGLLLLVLSVGIFADPQVQTEFAKKPLVNSDIISQLAAALC
tara:strand:+ start:124 stop:309 length:186 start_codon:yes stop_codon:yes gene_type:complete